MTSTTLTAIVLTVLFLAAVGTVLFLAWRRSRLPWKPLETPIGPIRYVAPEGFNVARLQEALPVAISILNRCVGWPLAAMFGAAQNIRVFVSSTNEWVDGYGRKIGGAQVGDILFVGFDLKSLLHEFAHASEWAIDRTVDDDHSGWTDKGIFRAQEDYIAWLEAPRS